METYLTLLYVTLEQESALKDFFLEKGWSYCKPDLSVLTDTVGPAEKPQIFRTVNEDIIENSELSGNDASLKRTLTKVVTKKGRKKVGTSPDITAIKVEIHTENEEFMRELDGPEKGAVDELTENDDGDNDDDFADDLNEINEEAVGMENNYIKKAHKRTVSKSIVTNGRSFTQGNLQPGTRSADQNDHWASGRKKRRVGPVTETTLDSVMSKEHKEKVDTDESPLYDKQYFRTLLTEALKSSPSGKETAKNEFSVCPQCGKSIKNTNMRRHLLSHLDLPYRCTRCTIFFRSEAELETHRQEKHIGEFVCSYCGMAYRFKNSLTEHIHMRHEGRTKMYECTVCGVKMCRKSHLDDHMNVHNNINPYSCDNCSKSYKNKSAYKRHLKDCGSGNKYVCDECGQLYKSAAGLLDHSKRCHDKTNSYLFYCVCESGFKTRAARCRHRLHCEKYQNQKDNKPGLIEQNITILRVTSTPKVEHAISENCLVPLLKKDKNNDCIEEGEVLSQPVAEHHADDGTCHSFVEGEIANSAEGLNGSD